MLGKEIPPIVGTRYIVSDIHLANLQNVSQTAKIAAAEANCTVAHCSARPAAIVLFQRNRPSQPRVKIVDSAAVREFSAGQFSGSIAVCAEFAAYSA